MSASGKSAARSNAFVVPVDEGGLGVYVQTESHVVIDISGYMTG